MSLFSWIIFCLCWFFSLLFYITLLCGSILVVWNAFEFWLFHLRCSFFRHSYIKSFFFALLVVGLKLCRRFYYIFLLPFAVIWLWTLSKTLSSQCFLSLVWRDFSLSLLFGQNSYAVTAFEIHSIRVDFCFQIDRCLFLSFSLYMRYWCNFMLNYSLDIPISWWQLLRIFQNALNRLFTLQ